MGTWRPGNHHPFPRKDQIIPLYEEEFGSFTMPVFGEDHVDMHRDLEEFGVIGSIARQDLRELGYFEEDA